MTSPQVFDTPQAIAFYQLCARKGALKLELQGLRRRGRSAYVICKEAYRLTGSRTTVLAKMQALVDAALEPCQRCGHFSNEHTPDCQACAFQDETLAPHTFNQAP